MDSDEAGFSLIEVLVALAISAALMTAAYRGLAIGMRGLRATDVENQMLQVAKAELSRAGIETELTAGEWTGKSGAVDWTISIRPYERAEAFGLLGKPHAYWVEVEARSHGHPIRRLTTLKLEGRADGSR